MKLFVDVTLLAASLLAQQVAAKALIEVECVVLKELNEQTCEWEGCPVFTTVYPGDIVSADWLASCCHKADPYLRFEGGAVLRVRESFGGKYQLNCTFDHNSIPGAGAEELPFYYQVSGEPLWYNSPECLASSRAGVVHSSTTSVSSSTVAVPVPTSTKTSAMSLSLTLGTPSSVTPLPPKSTSSPTPVKPTTTPTPTRSATPKPTTTSKIIIPAPTSTPKFSISIKTSSTLVTIPKPTTKSTTSSTKSSTTPKTTPKPTSTSKRPFWPPRPTTTAEPEDDCYWPWDCEDDEGEEDKSA